MIKPREWWIWNGEINYDGPFMLEPEHIPIEGQDHVIEKSAYDEIEAKLKHAEEWAEHKVRDAEVLQAEVEREREINKVLTEALEKYAQGAHCYDPLETGFTAKDALARAEEIRGGK